MKKLEYRYSNGIVCEHTIYINKKNTYKECGNSRTVDIFEKNSKYEFVGRGEYGSVELVTRYKYITTLLLR